MIKKPNTVEDSHFGVNRFIKRFVSYSEMKYFLLNKDLKRETCIKSKIEEKKGIEL